MSAEIREPDLEATYCGFKLADIIAAEEAVARGEYQLAAEFFAELRARASRSHVRHGGRMTRLAARVVSRSQSRHVS